MDMHAKWMSWSYICRAIQREKANMHMACIVSIKGINSTLHLAPYILGVRFKRHLYKIPKG